MTDPTFRQIRVFISSTFRDMAAERDYLVKFVFPQLRQLCESRGVVWGEVDLRWGITDEQSAEGQVLPLCLAEIQRCRPYFIGLLGERYGWIPEAIDPELIAQEPWLSEHLERSVTELEILHGVLKDPEMADRALFYFRDPAYLETLDEDQLENYIEVPWREDIERYGMAEAQRRVAERQAKLAALKERIRESELPLKENYRDPQELGKWVLSDLTAIINELYPEGSQPDPLAQEAMLHEAFARERARVYIGGEKYYAQLDEHLSASRQPVVVVGESGSGKSALLSNWGLKRRAENTDELVLMHFLGASTGSTDLANMLARLMRELKEHCEIPQDLPQTENELRQAFPNWLYMAAANRDVVLILDGLNQLEENAQELDWLPLELPEKAGLVLSALPSRALDVVNDRGWPSLIIEPLTEDERAQLVQGYLAQYSKQLSPERVVRIVADPQSENPLALRVLLEELRQFGVHEQLDEVIDRYLSAESIPEMYRLVLERCEVDYEVERPGLVRDALSCIWAARRGLSEVELLDLLGESNQPLPHRLWSPLYLALAGGLVDRGGLLDFFHDYLRQAVAERYLETEEKRILAHTRLANYFEGLEGYPTRKVDELPWQLAEAGEWIRLYELLANLDWFESLHDHSWEDLHMYWAAVEGHTDRTRMDAYQSVISESSRISLHLLYKLAYLLFIASFLPEAFSLFEEVERICRKVGDKQMLQACLCGQATILQSVGKLEEANSLLKEQEDICYELGDRDGLATSMGLQALILRTWGKLEEAIWLHKKQECIFRELGNKVRLAELLGNQTVILKELGQFEEAMAMVKEQEHLSRQQGDHHSLAHSLGVQAIIKGDLGQFEDAMRLVKDQERIYSQLGYGLGVLVSLFNQAQVLGLGGKHHEAIGLHKKVENICRESGFLELLQASLRFHARNLMHLHDFDTALNLLKEQEKVSLELNDPINLSRSLAQQAEILRITGKPDEALSLHQKEEHIYRELNLMVDLQDSLGNQARCLIGKNKLYEALGKLSDQEAICREIGLSSGLQSSLDAQIPIFGYLDNENRALELLEEYEILCKEKNDNKNLITTLIQKAIIYDGFGKHKKALELLNEHEMLCREMKDMKLLLESLYFQAEINYSINNLTESMKKILEHESASIEMKDEDEIKRARELKEKIFMAWGKLPDN